MERTAHTPSSCRRPWAPPPITATTAESARARASVATPDAAPVRTAVRTSPSITASALPVVASKTTTRAWVVGSPRLGLSGTTVITLSPSRC